MIKSIWSILLIAVLLLSCTKKDTQYYKRHYKENVSDYVLIKEKLLSILEKKDSIFKYRVEYTGRRFNEFSYLNDTTILQTNIHYLREEDRSNISNIMYKFDLNDVFVYRDSVKYIFGTIDKVIITNYKSDIRPKGGILIDNNTYIFFEPFEK